MSSSVILSHFSILQSYYLAIWLTQPNAALQFPQYRNLSLIKTNYQENTKYNHGKHRKPIAVPSWIATSSKTPLKQAPNQTDWKSNKHPGP